MAYGLGDFCSDLSFLLKAKGTDALDEIAGCLRVLLANPAFIAETFSDDTPKGKRTLFHDAASGAYVLAHVHEPGKRGKPHSHGASWAIYGTARGVTVMTEWTRINPPEDAHAEIQPATVYALSAGDARAYGPHVIHSTEHPQKTWVVRITGTKLSDIARYHFKPETDRLIEA